MLFAVAFRTRISIDENEDKYISASANKRSLAETKPFSTSPRSYNIKAQTETEAKESYA